MAQVAVNAGAVAGCFGVVANMNHECAPVLERGHAGADFTCVQVPQIPVSVFVKEVARKTKTPAGACVLALILVDRLCSKTGIVFGPQNAHRLAVTGLLVAAKLSNDCSGVSRFFAHMTGLPIADLNTMERSFLQLLEWDLHVDAATFERVSTVLPQVCMSAGKVSNKPVPLIH
eukprot:Hpha_TRINITY_DN16683_c0_g4::TRINITY_DN16683_c0_g4_i1::g.182262::m.182262